MRYVSRSRRLLGGETRTSIFHVVASLGKVNVQQFKVGSKWVAMRANVVLQHTAVIYEFLFYLVRIAEFNSNTSNYTDNTF